MSAEVLPLRRESAVSPDKPDSDRPKLTIRERVSRSIREVIEIRIDTECFEVTFYIPILIMTRRARVRRVDERLPVAWTTQTRPDGVETAPPVIWISGHGYSPEQALAIADAIRDAVATYHNAGGVA